MSTSSSPLVQAIQSVSSRILRAANGRRVQLVAVSKTKPNSLILEAYSAGNLRHFGENYVQELVEKAPQLPADIRWHFIGHLQSNKVKLLAAIPNLYLVECIDSKKLATALNSAWASRKVADASNRLRVLIQVNTSHEASKSGCKPEETVELFQHVVNSCPQLQPVGLMTIAALAETPQADCFSSLADQKTKVLAACGDKAGLNEENFELSMGMSGDFEVAIAQGSTLVRIGSTIFGAREYAPKASAATKEAAQSTSTTAQNT